MQWASAVSTAAEFSVAVTETVDIIHQQLPATPDLLIVFISPHHHANYQQLAPLLTEQLPAQVLIGCSAGGVSGDVSGGNVEVEQQPGLALTAACLPGVTLQPFYLQETDFATTGDTRQHWQQLIGVAPDQQPQFVLLADPFSINPEPILQNLDQVYPDSKKVGGLVSGAVNNQHTLFLQNNVYHQGLLGLALHGDIRLDTIVAQGCRPIGEPLFVTAAEQNKLVSLDGMPAVQVLEKLFQNAPAADQELFRHSLFIGIAMRDAQQSYQQGDFLIRHLAGIDSESGSITIAAIPPPNSVVQFHLRDAQTSAQDLETLLKHYHNQNPGDQNPGTKATGSLLFSCLGRGEQLYGEKNHDSALFKQYLGNIPLAGFFCNGEIGPIQNQTFLHAYTSVFGLFSPKHQHNS